MVERYQFNDISHVDFQGTERYQDLGKLRVDSAHLMWKKQGGDIYVEAGMDDIVRIIWKKVLPGRNQLGLQIKGDQEEVRTHIFTGFRNQDVSWLADFFHKFCGIPPEEQQSSAIVTRGSKKEATTSKPSTSRNHEASKGESHEKKSSKKQASVSKPPKPSRGRKSMQGPVNNDGSENRKEDSNAQGKSMDGFMFYSELEWENVKKDNPGVPHKALGRILLHRWRNMSAENQKAVCDAAEADKKFSSFMKRPRSHTKK